MTHHTQSYTISVWVAYLYVQKRRICMYISVYLYINTYMYSAGSLWYKYLYIVFIRTQRFTFTSELLLTNSSAISVRPFSAAHIRAVNPSYIYIHIKTYDIDIVKEVSIQNISYTIINI